MSKSYRETVKRINKAGNTKLPYWLQEKTYRKLTKKYAK